ncbi:gp190 [Mycobacterium phage Omega]|uniref:Uncharacterized protein n=1 Tax=Mycobacterium phage Omega TaxID=2907835 RepID=Q853X5_BPMOM|nr:gp190 [Mycobacterium phage Omega]AAN12833.1 hypothetical protein PBI_OMEGA_190 [Mycobacterium phage Omega]
MKIDRDEKPGYGPAHVAIGQGLSRDGPGVRFLTRARNAGGCAARPTPSIPIAEYGKVVFTTSPRYLCRSFAGPGCSSIE